jgi:hypothetical protein
MIYPINIKPAPCIVSGEHKGTEITHVGVSPQNLDIYTKTEVVKGEPSMLPLALRRVLGHVLKEAGRPGPFIITPDEQAEDVTYDPDSSAPPKDKPEPSEVELTHPKERKLKQELGLMPPETETPLEMPKYEKFPPSLPSEHPKEKALERQLEQGAVTARGEDKLGFDINEINKALDLLQKSWQPPDSKDLGYQFNPIHSTIYPGKLIKSVAPKIAKPTDFSRAMQAVTTHWLKKNPPTLRTPSGEDYEDDQLLQDLQDPAPGHQDHRQGGERRGGVQQAEGRGRKAVHFPGCQALGCGHREIFPAQRLGGQPDGRPRQDHQHHQARAGRLGSPGRADPHRPADQEVHG